MAEMPDGQVIDALREELVAISRRSYERGLVPGVSGNNSVRVPGADAMLIKVTGVSMGDMRTEDTALVSLGGDALDQGRRPSKEWRFHAAIYRARPEVGAVAHLHPPTAIAFSVAGQVPPLVTAAARGHLRSVGMVGLLPAGSVELANAVASLMAGTELRVVILREHGTVTVGPDLRSAYYRTEYLEDNCRVAIAAGLVAGARPSEIALAHDSSPLAEAV